MHRRNLFKILGAGLFGAVVPLPIVHKVAASGLPQIGNPFPQLGPDVTYDRSAMCNQLEAYQSGIQRMITFTGFEIRCGELCVSNLEQLRSK